MQQWELCISPCVYSSPSASEIGSRLTELLAGHRVWSIKATSIMAGRSTSQLQDRKWVDFNRSGISFTLPTCPEVHGCPAMPCIACIYT